MHALLSQHCSPPAGLVALPAAAARDAFGAGRQSAALTTQTISCSFFLLGAPHCVEASLVCCTMAAADSEQLAALSLGDRSAPAAETASDSPKLEGELGADDGLPLSVLFARGHAAFRDLDKGVKQVREIWKISLTFLHLVNLLSIEATSADLQMRVVATRIRC